MEPSDEPVSVRCTRINSQIADKCRATSVLSKEGLLDALQVLYDECNCEHLKKTDRDVQTFLEENKAAVKELKRARVNITDFEIKAVIGRGRFGDVHVVKEKQTGDLYAMKSVKKSRSNPFKEERDIMAQSRSVWLTSLRYAFQDETSLFFVMDYHPGGDLLGLLYRQGGTLPESAASFYVAEVATAVNDLHSMGYVHRDVKPDNVLVDRCGHLKLADFGSAARIDAIGDGLPVGTPEYIAPEVLALTDNKMKEKACYGKSCDFWSIGVLAYELTVGNPPFTGQSTTAIYSKIMTHGKNLKFPPDIVLSQAYVSLVRSLIADQKQRLTYEQMVRHPLFKNVDFHTIREQIPPFIPKITSDDDTGNFSDVRPKKNEPDIENFKRKTQFSGRNLPFIGFTFTRENCDYQASYDRSVKIKDETVENLKQEVRSLRRKLMKSDKAVAERQTIEKRLEEKIIKLESVENLRDKLERDLAKSLSENVVLKRTLELERKDRSEVERKALDLIKTAKLKWETYERAKIESLSLELEQQKEKIAQLTETNRTLDEQLKHVATLENKHKTTAENLEKLSRKSVVGLESRLEKVTAETQSQLSELKADLSLRMREKESLVEELITARKNEASVKDKLKENAKIVEDFERRLKQCESDAFKKIGALEEENGVYKREIDNLKQKLYTVNNDKQLEKEVEVKKRELQNATEQIQNLTVKLKGLETELLLNQRTIDSLREEHSHLQKEHDSREETYKLKVTELEDLLKRLQNGITKLESNGDRESVLREQVTRLEDQLVKVHETSAVLKEELGQLKRKHWRTEKELENAEIDKRIFERESKGYKEELEKLKKEVEVLKEEGEKARGCSERTEEEMRGLREETERERKTIEDLKGELRRKEGEVVGLRSELAKIESEHEGFINKIQSLSEENDRLQKSLADSKAANSNTADLLETKEKQLQNTELNLEALREACTILEDQLIEYERIHASMKDTHLSLNANNERLLQNLVKTQEEVRESRKSANEEKSLRLLAETKAKRLTEDLESSKEENEGLRKELEELRRYSSGLAEELNLLQERTADLEVDLKAKERLAEDLKEENRSLKEESSGQLTRLEQMRSANYEAKRRAEEGERANERLKEALREMEQVLEEKRRFYEEREMKAEATMRQQTKLINYLQTKIEECNNKKKSFAEKLFSGSKKENVPPLSNVLNKELEVQLNREREKNKALLDQIDNYKNKKGSTVPVLSKDVVTEGWIRVPKKTSKAWEKCYAKLLDDTLFVYDDPQQNRHVDAFNFKKQGLRAKFVMEPLRSEIKVPVTDRDLPFVVKLEVGRFPSETFVFMLSSEEEKKKWYDALKEVFGEFKVSGDVIFEIDADVKVNCLVDLGSERFLLGTERGLFGCNKGKLTEIEGLKSVKGVTVWKQCGVVLLVAGGDLLWADSSHVFDVAECASCSKPALKYSRVCLKNLTRFRFLETSKNEMFCVATSKQLVLAKYERDTKEFFALRILDTAEPTSCAVFTKNTLIVGADKFFEIDLNTFAAEEFLDNSDVALSPAIKCHKIKSFPLAVFQINKSPVEYLCCYNEFSIFVDEYGRSTRTQELKWKHKPRALRYASPYLYVVHFAAVEVHKIKTDCETFKFDLAEAECVGENKLGIFVVKDEKVMFLDARKLDGDEISSECTESESDRFSFTSSVENCLEGTDCSDSLSDGCNGRKVTFTDL